eukprot:4393621-Amphidinium_carterae.2
MSMLERDRLSRFVLDTDSRLLHRTATVTWMLPQSTRALAVVGGLLRLPTLCYPMPPTSSLAVLAASLLFSAAWARPFAVR